MKSRTLIVSLAVALLVAFVILWMRSQRASNDLIFWMQTAGGKDWSELAKQNQPEAQFLMGMNLIRTNIVIMTDRIPTLADLPLVGRRFFQKTQFQIDPAMSLEGRNEVIP